MEDNTDGETRNLFIQLDTLTFKDRNSIWEWRQKCRWVHFEEDLNETTDSFNAVHYPAIKYKHICEFREYLQNMVVLLDINCTSRDALLNIICSRLGQDNHCSIEDMEVIRMALMARHVFVGEKLVRKVSTASTVSVNSDTLRRRTDVTSSLRARPLQRNPSVLSGGSSDIVAPVVPQASTLLPEVSMSPIDNRPRQFHSDLAGRLKFDCYEAVSVQVGGLEHLEEPIMICIRLGGPGLNGQDVGDGTLGWHHVTEIGNKLALRFIFIFIGPEMDKETRKPINYFEIGRVFGTMMSDATFRSVAYNAQGIDDFSRGLEEFLDRSLVMPLIKEASITILGGMLLRITEYLKEQYEMSKLKLRKVSVRRKRSTGINNLRHPRQLETLHSQQELRTFISPEDEHGEELLGYLPLTIEESASTSTYITVASAESKEEIEIKSTETCCTLFCPPFVCLARDFIGYVSRFTSDIKDGFSKENAPTVFLGIVFVYFTVLAPAITFGALLNNLVSRNFTVGMCLIASGVFQFIFSLFGGQPLIIVGMTGPVFIIETAIGLICNSLQIELGIVRFWVGIYTALFSILIIGCNVVQVVRLIRRSVEEVFNSFIGIYYIFKSMVTMIRLIPRTQYQMTNSNGSDVINRTTTMFDYDPYRHLTRAQASTTLLLAFLMLFVSIKLAGIKRGSYFTRHTRNLMGSLNIPLGIIIVIIVERVFFADYNLDTLHIPMLESMKGSSFAVKPVNFTKLVSPDIPVTVHGFTIALGICLSVLICTETMLSGVTVAKAERMLKKPCLFALDFLLCMVIFPTVSGCLGWPFVTGAIVRSTSHTLAMTKWDLKTAPGVAHKIIGCAEQRVSGMIVGILVALSVLLGVILTHIPTAAMYGMFLYMGVMGLRDLLLVRRLLALMKRRKYWLGRDYLTNLKYKHLCALVAIQITTIGILVGCNCVTEFARIPYTSFAFPVILLAYALIREFLLPKCPCISSRLEAMDPRHKITLSAAKRSKKPKLQKSQSDSQSHTPFINGTELPRGPGSSSRGSNSSDLNYLKSGARPGDTTSSLISAGVRSQRSFSPRDSFISSRGSERSQPRQSPLSQNRPPHPLNTSPPPFNRTLSVNRPHQPTQPVTSRPPDRSRPSNNSQPVHMPRSNSQSDSNHSLISDNSALRSRSHSAYSPDPPRDRAVRSRPSRSQDSIPPGAPRDQHAQRSRPSPSSRPSNNPLKTDNLQRRSRSSVGSPPPPKSTKPNILQSDI